MASSRDGDLESWASEGGEVIVKPPALGTVGI